MATPRVMKLRTLIHNKSVHEMLHSCTHMIIIKKAGIFLCCAEKLKS